MMWLTPVYSFTYPATPNDARSRTSAALAIVPLNTTIGGFSGATRRRLRTRSMPGRWGDAGQGPQVDRLRLRLQRRQHLSPVCVATPGVQPFKGSRTVPHKGGVVGDQHRLDGDHGGGGHYATYRYGLAIALERVAGTVSSSL